MKTEVKKEDQSISLNNAHNGKPSRNTWNKGKLLGGTNIEEVFATGSIRVRKGPDVLFYDFNFQNVRCRE